MMIIVMKKIARRRFRHYRSSHLRSSSETSLGRILIADAATRREWCEEAEGGEEKRGEEEEEGERTRAGGGRRE